MNFDALEDEGVPKIYITFPRNHLFEGPGDTGRVAAVPGGMLPLSSVASSRADCTAETADLCKFSVIPFTSSIRYRSIRFNIIREHYRKEIA